MKLIDKIIQSKYQPKDTNVIWIDESGVIPVIKIYSNGVWKQVELNELTPEQVEAIKDAVKSDISYNDLDEDSLPTINDVPLSGDLTTEDLNLLTDSLKEVTYEELIELRDNNELIPGMQYRITNYNCTTSLEYTRSAGHKFDIIVTADNEFTLNENARATWNREDAYFDDCKLEAWELKYSLDNDKNRFAWACNGQYYSVSEISKLKVPYETLPTELKDIIEREQIDYDDDDSGFFLHRVYQNKTFYSFSHDGGASLNSDFEIVLSNDTSYAIGDLIQIQWYQQNYEDTTIMEINGDDMPSGKGVIYYMKDELDNECPYDFKNIMFKRWAVSEVTDQTITQAALEDLNDMFVFDGDETMFQTRFGYRGSNCTYGSTTHVVDPNDTGWYYTFSIIAFNAESGKSSINDIEDGSIKGNNYYNDESGGGFYCNTIRPRYNNMASDNDDGIDGAQVLNNIVLNGYYSTGDLNPYIYGCYNNSFGGNCFNNTFGINCFQNSFGNNCANNSLGNYCQNNSFGNYCNWNSFGISYIDNLFGNNCANNSFGSYCQNSSFGNSIYNNSFGNYYSSSSFGNDCYYNLFGNYCQSITVFDGVHKCSVTGGSQNSIVLNAQILNGTGGGQNKLTITFVANTVYTQVAAKTTGGTLKIFNPADLVL